MMSMMMMMMMSMIDGDVGVDDDDNKPYLSNNTCSTNNFILCIR
jgi:hypothetical protein